MKKIIYSITVLALCAFLSTAFGQETFPRNDVLDDRSQAYAFTQATIFTDASTQIENATLLIKEGKILAVGNDLTIPKGFIRVDLKNKFIYPSFVELHTNYGLPKVKEATGGGFGGREQIMSKTEGAYNANEAIKAHYDASSEFKMNDKVAEGMRKMGFGAALSHRHDGLSRGSSVMVNLGNQSNNKSMLKDRAAAHYSLIKGTSRQNYPSSTMGYVSCLRQTYLDAEWYDSQDPPPFADKTLEAWIASQDLPQVFEAGNWLSTLRADKIGDEFDVQYILRGGGDEYKRINEMKATEAAFIIPVNFPSAYDVEDPFDADRVSLADMLHWELAPTNPGILAKHGISFAITSSGTDQKDFMPNIRKAIKHGLDESAALKALTEVPAQLMKMENRIGRIKEGLEANFIITSGKIFDEKTEIMENWVQGVPFRYKDLESSDFSGAYVLTAGGQAFDFMVEGKSGAEKCNIAVNDSTKIDVKSKLSKDLITLSFSPQKDGEGGYRLSGWSTSTGWKGSGQDSDGNWLEWTARKQEKGEDTGDKQKEKSDKKNKKEDDSAMNLGKVIYPFVAFGREELPKDEVLLIKNTTVWTNEASGILRDTDVLLKDGKIEEVGENIRERGARVIDGTGKHLTSGIIDEHTHIGGGGNDRATNSAMVRIGDQINPEQINIYRTLSGGVTAAQVLHGSANPIGGQSALIKLRWGESPENMKIVGADEYIKFALGENVKRSRNTNSIRYPQTRMGVEQVYVDAFTNGREYEKEWNEYHALSPSDKMKATKPRRDLMKEAILEILNGERFITCHSYVQSEINMLMKVAEQFDFTINTFTHIMEGYKVADKMREHGVGASTFSDWWNYKWEVRYAIPYNATIMHNEGVVTAINSDDSNSGRRLNQEAAKSIKYGNMSEEDAWKMVTLNPAKLLHLDDRMGSITKGKDADVVLWSDHPLSIYARAEKTIVDGKVYYDMEEDEKAREALKLERARLIVKMKGEKSSGKKMQRPDSAIQLEFHCEEDYSDYLEKH